MTPNKYPLQARHIVLESMIWVRYEKVLMPFGHFIIEEVRDYADFDLAGGYAHCQSTPSSARRLAGTHA